MTLALPTFAKVRELRLAIQHGPQTASRLLNRKDPTLTPYRERWVGSIVFQAMTRDEIAQFRAFLSRLDGRVTALRVPSLAGYSTHALTGVRTTYAALETGANTATIVGTAGVVPRGTLFGVGTITDATYQIIEATRTVNVDTFATMQFAPRNRYARAANTALALNPDWKLILASDDVQASMSVTHGTVTLDVQEAL